MTERYVVRCTVAVGWKMEGIYLAGLTLSGMIATWKPGRARRFDSTIEAAAAGSRLAKKFTGTEWAAELVSGE